MAEPIRTHEASAEKESVKITRTAMEVLRTVARSSGRSNTETIERTLLRYAEVFQDGYQAGMRDAGNMLKGKK